VVRHNDKGSVALNPYVCIVLSVFSCVAASGGVCVFCLFLGSRIIAKRLEERYRPRIEKEGQKKKIYVSKEKFDTEYATYRVLSRVFFELVKYISCLVPADRGFYPSDEEVKQEYEKSVYKSALNSCSLAEEALECYAPLMSLELFERYEEVLRLSKIQVVVFQERWNLRYIQGRQEDADYTPEEHHRTAELEMKWKLVTNSVREYFAKLDVVS